ncbi:hypothetical protein [Ammoniphilus sp. 3BR4]|uniref:hypothetical protein n=1 Tax=Ammoniphilus sp. 3BR4 TaxID=3158265 RepID=UPI00346581EC
MIPIKLEFLLQMIIPFQTDNNNIMENIQRDSEILLTEKKHLMEKRSALLKESPPSEWGDSTPKELIALNQRIKQIDAEIEGLH